MIKKITSALAAFLICGAALAGPPPVSPASPGIPGLMFPTQTPDTIQSGVYPPAVLKSAITKVESGGTVNVCIVGDSTSIGTPAGVNSLEGIQYQVQHWMTVRNHGVKFTFQDFGIPGTTYTSFNGNAYAAAQSYGLSWYASSGANWYQYVNNAGCDIEFFDFGVNDAYATGTTLFKAVIQNALFSTGTNAPPGIIFITNAIANPSAGAPYNTLPYQLGYISTPSLVRSVVGIGASGFTPPPNNLMAGQALGLIDINRLFQQTVLGEDYEDQTSYNGLSALPTNAISLSSTTPYTFPQTDGDFDIALSIPSALPAMNSVNSIYFTLGSMNGGTGSISVSAEVSPDSGGGQVTIQDTSGALFSNAHTWGGSTLTIEVAKKSSLVSITINGTLITQDYIMPRAPFTPEILLTGTGTYPATITKWAYSVHRTYNAILSASQAWGPSVFSSPAAQTTASGGAVIYLTLPLSSVVTVGQPITDVPVPNAIPAGTLITSVNSSTGAIGLSNPVSSIGVTTGDSISVGSVTSPTGGNGINHDASDALNLVYQRAFESTNLCLVCYAESGPFQARATVVTTAGTTYTAAYGLKHLTQNPAGLLATHTTALPPYPYDGQTFQDASTQIISAETVTAGSAPSGTTVVGGTQPYAISVGNALNFRYYQNLNEWVEGASP